jgi:hypothetical protein
MIDITKAEYIDEYKIELYFEDGRSNIVDFYEYTLKPGLFARLKDRDYFRSFYISAELGTICWGEDFDISPESLYSRAFGDLKG